MQKPKKPVTGAKVSVTTLMDAQIKRRLDEYTLVTRRTRSGYVELALLDRFRKDEQEVKGGG
jgi:predicted transcriptional regulator